MAIKRDAGQYLSEMTDVFPIVTVTGPRQSGKTTLCRERFPSWRHVTLEALDVRQHALEDPRGFLAELGHGVVLDEVQRAPELLSYIQGIVDDDPRPGRYVLTGSANFALLESVSQSLAGRTSLLTLLPCSRAEVRRFASYPAGLWESVWTGSYPAIFDRRLPPREWFGAYAATYVERDVRSILRVADLTLFQTFLRLCAARTGQLLNLSQLGGDVGVSHNTARAWLSVLETSYLVMRLPPFWANIGKRLVRTPKLHFLDTGLACHLLGIRTPAELEHHPLRGPLLESWVVSEAVKALHHAGETPRVWFYRDRSGNEVDLLVELGPDLLAVEVKAGATVPMEAVRTLRRRCEPIASDGTRRVIPVLVHGGDASSTRLGVTLHPWHAPLPGGQGAQGDPGAP